MSLLRGKLFAGLLFTGRLFGAISRKQGDGSINRTPWVSKGIAAKKWLTDLVKDLERESVSIREVSNVEANISQLSLNTHDIYITLEKIRKIKLKKKQRQEDDLVLFM